MALIKGDLFGMMDAVVYCQAHFRQQQEHNFEDFPGGGQPYFGYDEAGIPTGFAGLYTQCFQFLIYEFRYVCSTYLVKVFLFSTYLHI